MQRALATLENYLFLQPLIRDTFLHLILNSFHFFGILRKKLLTFLFLLRES